MRVVKEFVNKTARSGLAMYLCPHFPVLITNLLIVESIVLPPPPPSRAVGGNPSHIEGVEGGPPPCPCPLHLRFPLGDDGHLLTNVVTPSCIVPTVSLAWASVIPPFFTWPVANAHWDL